MEVEHPIAVSILAFYFVFIFALLWRIKSQLRKVFSNCNLRVSLFLLLSVISLATTWTYMFKFFFYSYNEWKLATNYTEPVSLNSISLWLDKVSLFDSAWRQVSVGDWQWLWSHQLCSLTVAVWTPILAIEGTRRNIPYVWAYMILGQVVAISVASSLFFAVILVSNPIANKEPSNNLKRSLCLSTIGGIVTVIVSPYVATTSAFMVNLLIMHILLVFPLIHLQESSSSSSTTFNLVLYTLAASANFSIYVNQWCRCLDTLIPLSKNLLHDIYHQIITTFFHHPAQSSISYDIVCMQFISVAWMWTYSKSEYKQIPIWAALLMVLTPLLSASVTLPLFLAGCEYKKLVTKEIKKM